MLTFHLGNCLLSGSDMAFTCAIISRIHDKIEINRIFEILCVLGQRDIWIDPELEIIDEF